MSDDVMPATDAWIADWWEDLPALPTPWERRVTMMRARIDAERERAERLSETFKLLMVEAIKSVADDAVVKSGPINLKTHVAWVLRAMREGEVNRKIIDATEAVTPAEFVDKQHSYNPVEAIELMAKRIAELMKLLHRLTDHETDPCHYDHHDLCQTHSLHERPCVYEEAKEALGDE